MNPEQLPKLAVLDDYQNVSGSFADWEKVRQRCRLDVFRHPLPDFPAGAELLKDYRIVCCMRERTPFPKKMLERLPNLELLVTTGTNNAAIDLAFAKESGVLVCGTPSPGHAASETAWAHVTALAKRLLIEDRLMRSGTWQSGVGCDLRGRTLGIMGLGRHGKLVAGYGRAFGMRCLAWSQNLTEERCVEAGAELTDKETLLRESDFLTVHLKLSERTRNLVAAEELAAMKPSAYLVNTSRSEIVNEKDLIEALKTGVIAGAGLDVFDREPLPVGHPLLGLESVSLSPHTGYVTEETYRVFYRNTVEAVVGWLEGSPIRVLN